MDLPVGQPTSAAQVTVTARPLVLAGMACAVLTGVLTTTQDVLESRTPVIDMGVGWSALHTCWVATMFVAFLGLTVLQRPWLDRFGRVATRVCLVGTGAMTMVAGVETVTLWGAAEAPQGDPPPVALAAILLAYAAYVLGVLLFSVATFRARVLPRAAAAGLFVAVLVKLATGDVFGPLSLLGIAVAALGVSAAWVLRRHRLATA